MKILSFALLVFVLTGCHAIASPANSATTAVMIASPNTAAAVEASTPVVLSLPTLTPDLAPPITPTVPIPPTPVFAIGEELTIDALLKRDIEGSPITIEQQLEDGANYARYTASYLSEGNKIYGLLTVPFGDPPEDGFKAIVFNHGYIPPDQYRTTERYVAYVDGFARNGYIVYRPDYRGHAFSDGEARGAYGYPDYTIDVLNATAALKNYSDADPNRIGMWGHSMGGYITLRSMVVDPDIKAGVIWAGVVANYPDLLTRWRRPNNNQPPPSLSTARRWRTQLQEQYGTPEENPAFYASISANTYLDDLSGPIQLHHGTADTSVPYEFSTTLADQLEAAGQPAEIFTYTGDDHNLSQGFGEAMARSVDFFDEHVKGID